MPEFRVSYTITTDKLDLLYKRLKPKGVTMTALLAKACGVALAKHPIMFAGGPGALPNTRAGHAAASCMAVPVHLTMAQGGSVGVWPRWAQFPALLEDLDGPWLV